MNKELTLMEREREREREKTGKFSALRISFAATL